MTLKKSETSKHDITPTLKKKGFQFPEYHNLIQILQSYIGYYIAHLLLNALLMSLYTVQVAANHSLCITRSGLDVTEYFDFTFYMGFFLLLAEFINAHVLCIYFRSQVQIAVSKNTLITANVSENVDSCFKVATLFISFLQYRIKNSHQVKMCIMRYNLLK